MSRESKRPELDKSQLYFGVVVHWVTIVSCLIVLVAPIFILLFPKSNLLNPNLIFNAIFAGKKSAEIWAAAGVLFVTGDFWRLFWGNLFSPDGFATAGVVLGCSVTLWAMIPAVWQFLKKKEYFYAGVGVFVAALIGLAMSGVVRMAG
jgi:multisubunit Na+/H+ antiporter MnhB subunit